MNSKVYLLDTSIIIDAVENILTLSDNGRNKIIITDVVLNETDHLKSSLGNVGYMARRFNNFFNFFDSVQAVAKLPSPVIPFFIGDIGISRCTTRCKFCGHFFSIIGL